MDRFAESHYKQHRAHLPQYRSSPYRKLHAPPRPSVAFAPSPSRSHVKGNIRVKPDIIRRNNRPSREDDTLVNDSVLDDHYQEPDSDDSFFHWDEEATLLSALMDEEMKDNEDEELEMLADSLQGPFTAQGKRKKKEIAEVLVGTHNHVKKVFKLLDENVDVHYGKGAHMFKTASLTIEGTFFAQQADFQEAYNATESKIEGLFAELKEDFAARDRLWLDLEKQMNEILLPPLDKVKDTPAQVERTIAKLEKHSKALESSGKEATASARKIVDDFMKKT